MNIRGTYAFLPPEIQKAYNEKEIVHHDVSKLDIYCLGKTLLNLIIQDDSILS